jgi:hypothetical protein
MDKLKFGSAVAAGLLLAGCLVSDKPMFDAASGSASPFESGRYEACSDPPEADGEDCQILDIERREDGAYDFQVDAEDRIVVRFHQFDPANYAVQFEDDQSDGYQYYWARRDGDALLLAMIWCEDFPAALRDAMLSGGLISREGDSSTCTALKPEAVVVAAKAYRDGAVVSDSILRIVPLR